MRQTGADVRRRLSEARERLQAAAAGDEPVSRLEALEKEVALLEGLTERAAAKRRRVVLRVAFFLLVAVAGVLQMLRLPEVELTVEATTRHLTLSSGSASEVVLEAVDVKSLSVDGPGGHRRWCQLAQEEAAAAEDCRPVADLQLNGLTLHSDGRFALSRVGGCLDLEVHNGSTTLQWSFLSDEEAYGVGREKAGLQAGDAARICGTFAEPLSLARPRRLVLGYEGATPALRPAPGPSLNNGVVVLVSTAQERALRPTDTVIVDRLRDAFLTVRLDQPMAVSLVGHAGALTSTWGGVTSRDLRPTLLRWATHSEWVRGLLTLLGGALGLSVALSDGLGKLGLGRSGI